MENVIRFYFVPAPPRSTSSLCVVVVPSCIHCDGYTACIWTWISQPIRMRLQPIEASSHNNNNNNNYHIKKRFINALVNGSQSLPRQTLEIDRCVLISTTDKSNSISRINFMGKIDLHFACTSTTSHHHHQQHRIKYKSMEIDWCAFAGEIALQKKMETERFSPKQLRWSAKSSVSPLRTNSEHILRIWPWTLKWINISQYFLFNSIDLSLPIYWQRKKHEKQSHQIQIDSTTQHP